MPLPCKSLDPYILQFLFENGVAYLVGTNATVEAFKARYNIP